jgi:hypothetical protein
MSKIMTIAGIILLGLGLALGIIGVVSPQRLGAMFLSLDTAAILLVGGILSLGLGGIIAALENTAPAMARPIIQPEQAPLAGSRARMDEAIKAVAAQAPKDQPSTLPVFPDLRGAKTAAAATGAAASTIALDAVSNSVEIGEESIPDTSTAPSPSVADTINALERAKSDMRAAFGGNSGPTSPVTALKPATPPIPSVAIPPPHDEPEDEEVAAVEEAAPEASSGELYVIEERTIRGRPARILSDGTVEAETDEGWMRFENLEHLNEYLDG